MTRTVLVAYQWAASAQGAAVGPDGAVDLSRVTPGLSEYDQVAIELARGLADAAGARLLAVGVGGDTVATSLATKAVGSRGPDEVVVVHDPAPSTTSVATSLAEVVGGEPDVLAVVCGDASGDHGTRLVPGLLAGLLGWPVVGDVARVTPGDGSLTVVCALRSGSETLEVQGPAVLAAGPDAVKPRVPGMRDILAAARKPVRKAVPSGVRTGTARVVGASRIDPPRRRQNVIVVDDPAAAASRLVDEMRTAGVL